MCRISRWAVIAFVGAATDAGCQGGRVPEFDPPTIVREAIENAVFLDPVTQLHLKRTPPLVLDLRHAVETVSQYLGVAVDSSAAGNAAPRQAHTVRDWRSVYTCPRDRLENGCSLVAQVTYATVRLVEYRLGADSLSVWVFMSWKDGRTIGERACEALFVRRSDGAWRFDRIHRVRVS